MPRLVGCVLGCYLRRLSASEHFFYDSDKHRRFQNEFAMQKTALRVEAVGSGGKRWHGVCALKKRKQLFGYLWLFVR